MARSKQSPTHRKRSLQLNKTTARWKKKHWLSSSRWRNSGACCWDERSNSKQTTSPFCECSDLRKAYHYTRQTACSVGPFRCLDSTSDWSTSQRIILATQMCSPV
uniref:(northern house mosquito) hypothetical protein n=1 Tax=Culex pipiens TaxID=7175 RepID=A0A8D8PDK5_CULPI